MIFTLECCIKCLYRLFFSLGVELIFGSYILLDLQVFRAQFYRSSTGNVSISQVAFGESNAMTYNVYTVSGLHFFSVFSPFNSHCPTAKISIKATDSSRPFVIQNRDDWSDTTKPLQCRRLNPDNSSRWRWVCHSSHFVIGNSSNLRAYSGSRPSLVDCDC